MKPLYPSLLFLALFTSPLLALPQPLLFWQEDRLEDLTQSNEAPWPGLRDAVQAEADRIVAAGETYSVTFNERTPPSGDPRDYYSTGPYWWPNPETPDGLPYVRRDGQFNPERDRVSDREPLHRMIHDVRYCALAWHLTGEDRYAAHGAKLLHVWFLDPETGMRPNLNHAQAIPGRSDGRGTGIIDAHPLGELADGILLLAHSPHLPAEDFAALREWYEDYFLWLITSDHGRDEAASINNHGTAFDLQAAGLAHFIGNRAYLRHLLESSVRARVYSQIRSSGAQPEELVRTRTWSYSTENLEHFYRLALLGLDVEVDVTAFEAPNGASLPRALQYLLPYFCQPEAWPYPQETAWETTFAQNVLEMAWGLDPELQKTLLKARSCLRLPANDSLAPLLRP
ncbi:MAG: alginate lyase family protein [Verrucomicrobiota bacterium JB022]|nr:alginate lyase family protein [Verrucomicrobiota bacterium JB022]